MRILKRTIKGQKKNIKVALVGIMVAVLALFLSGCSTASETIGVLDVNKLMSESQKVKQFQEELSVKGKELSDKLESEKPNLSPEEFQARQEAAYGEFLKLRQDMESQIEQAIKTAVEEVGKERKIGVIMFKNTVAHGGVDVTDDVLKKLQ